MRGATGAPLKVASSNTYALSLGGVITHEFKTFTWQDWRTYHSFCSTGIDGGASVSGGAFYVVNPKDKSVDPTTGSASVPVNVTREAATFSVVVPTTLPISVDADGNVTTATDTAIINNSGATVAVTKVELNSQSNWTLAAYNRDILNLPVDAKQFGLQMNIGDKTVATSNSGTSDILSDSLNAQIAKGQNCAVTYNALFPARTAAVSDTQIANVVFTVAWA